MGIRAWQQLIGMEAKIRKERQETIYKQAARRRAFVEWTAIILLTSATAGAIIWFIWFLMTR
jgi:hypothetical protein